MSTDEKNPLQGANPSPPETISATVNQDDIDALMAASADATETAGDTAVSQDDIDALMGLGITPPVSTLSVPTPRSTPESVPSSESKRGDQKVGRSNTVSVDLLNQDRVARSRMPTMEVLNDRFARAFRGSLFNYLRVNADIIPTSAQMTKYGDFIGKIALPSYFVMVSMTPLRGSMLFILDPYLCYAVIEAFFGGNGKLEPKLEGRDFSVIEQRVFNQIIDHAIADFTSAWDPIVKLQMKVTRSDVKAQFVGIAASPEVVVASSFEIEMERWRGKFFVCFPYHSVEPFREQLISGVAADQTEMDATWKTALHKDIQDACVEATVLLAARNITFGEASKLQAGDIIPFDKPDIATLFVEDIPIGDGRYGVSNRKYALCITQYRSPDEEDILKAVQIKKE